MKKEITEENCDMSSAYERTILLNKQLGLQPGKPRYSVIGDTFYGVYDDYHKAKEDTYLMAGVKIIKEPRSNTHLAVQKCYEEFYKNNGQRYMYQSITSGNTIIDLATKPKLFTHI